MPLGQHIGRRVQPQDAAFVIRLGQHRDDLEILHRNPGAGIAQIRIAQPEDRPGEHIGAEPMGPHAFEDVVFEPQPGPRVSVQPRVLGAGDGVMIAVDIGQFRLVPAVTPVGGGPAHHMPPVDRRIAIVRAAKLRLCRNTQILPPAAVPAFHRDRLFAVDIERGDHRTFPRQAVEDAEMRIPQFVRPISRGVARSSQIEGIGDLGQWHVDDPQKLRFISCAPLEMVGVMVAIAALGGIARRWRGNRMQIARRAIVQQRPERGNPHSRILDPVFTREMQPDRRAAFEADHGRAGIAAQRGTVMGQPRCARLHHEPARREPFHVIEAAKVTIHLGWVVAERVGRRIAHDRHQFVVPAIRCRQRQGRHRQTGARDPRERHIRRGILGEIGEGLDLGHAGGVRLTAGLFHEIDPRLIGQIAGTELEHAIPARGAPRHQLGHMAVGHDQPMLWPVLGDHPACPAPIHVVIGELDPPDRGQQMFDVGDQNIGTGGERPVQAGLALHVAVLDQQWRAVGRPHDGFEHRHRCPG